MINDFYCLSLFERLAFELAFKPYDILDNILFLLDLFFSGNIIYLAVTGV